MITKTKIDSIVISAIKAIIKDHKNFDLDSFFVGPNATIESIDVVQIVSFVEEKLEELGFEGFDLFEKVFECQNLTFSEFSILILKILEN